MLDERKSAILRAIVQEYITTAQPVGSTLIANAPGGTSLRITAPAPTLAPSPMLTGATMVRRVADVGRTERYRPCRTLRASTC